MKLGRGNGSGTDRFHVVVGAAAIVVGTITLARGAATGWALLLVVLGGLLLTIQWMIASGIEFDIAGPSHILAIAVGCICLWAAAMYLTRGADDLPLLLPGHDGDSGRTVLLPGLVTSIAGSVLVCRALLLARPRRPDRPE